MVFLFVSMVSLFEVDNDTDDLVGIGEKKEKGRNNNSMRHCAIMMQLDQEQKQSFIQT